MIWFDAFISEPQYLYLVKCNGYTRYNLIPLIMKLDVYAQ